jgi:hypothetical protein
MLRLGGIRVVRTGGFPFFRGEGDENDENNQCEVFLCQIFFREIFGREEVRKWWCCEWRNDIGKGR